jgi:hypothetical protein
MEFSPCRRVLAASNEPTISMRLPRKRHQKAGPCCACSFTASAAGRGGAGRGDAGELRRRHVGVLYNSGRGARRVDQSRAAESGEYRQYRQGGRCGAHGWAGGAACRAKLTWEVTSGCHDPCNVAPKGEGAWDCLVGASCMVGPVWPRRPAAKSPPLHNQQQHPGQGHGHCHACLRQHLAVIEDSANGSER